jgi:hypothetical protein
MLSQHVLRASAPVAILVSVRKGHSSLPWRLGALSLLVPRFSKVGAKPTGSACRGD